MQGDNGSIHTCTCTTDENTTPPFPFTLLPLPYLFSLRHSSISYPPFPHQESTTNPHFQTPRRPRPRARILRASAEVNSHCLGLSHFRVILRHRRRPATIRLRIPTTMTIMTPATSPHQQLHDQQRETTDRETPQSAISLYSAPRRPQLQSVILLPLLPPSLTLPLSRFWQKVNYPSFPGRDEFITKFPS